MKKIMLFAGLMLTAALSLTNCQKAEFTGPEAQKGGKTITLSATALQMKTTNDGLSTLWASGDNLTVFHAVHGTTEYVKDGQFTIGEGVGTTSGVFTVTPKEELTPGEHYDWYILKNGRPKLTSPNGSGVSYNVGEPRQAQAGFNSSVHIAGTDTYMMFGHIWNAAAEDDLAVALTHMNSLLKVQVTNATAAPIHIYNVEFVAKDDISGTAYVDFTKDDLVITSDASSNHASIGVTGTEALAAGATADFFIGIRPFTAKAGDVLELRVNGYPKKLTLTEDVTFAPGHEKVLTFSYDNTPGDLSGDYMIAGRYNGEMYAGYGIALAPGTYDGSGGNNPVMFAKKVLVVGDQIYYDGDMTISGSGALTIPTTIDNYKFKVTKVTEGEYAGLYTIQNYQDKYMTSTLEVDGNCIGFVDTPEAGSYMDINANGENAEDGYRIVAAFAPSPNRRHFLFADKGGNWGRFTMFPDGDKVPAPAFLIPWGTPKENPIPRLVLTDVTVRAAGADNAEYAVVSENNPQANPWLPDVVEWTGCVTDAYTLGETLYYSVDANPSTEAGREGTITVRLVDPNAEFADVVGVINVTQGPKPSKNFVKVTAAPAENWLGDYLIVYEGEGGVGAYAYDGSKSGTGLDCESVADGIKTIGPKVAVVIENGNSIPAEANLLESLVHIKFNTHAKAPSGSYGIWNKSNTHCIGVQGRNTAYGVQMNDNTDDRFFQTITYDETNHSVRIYNTNSGNNANTGVWRYSTTGKCFGVVKDEEDANCAHIQLYKLEE